MKVMLCADMDEAEARLWRQALSAALPEAQWLDPDAARCHADTVQAAVVANPPPGSLQGLPKLRLIQSLWAGVDRLLADPSLPPGVPIARMVDPLMSAAMAETALGRCCRCTVASTSTPGSSGRGCGCSIHNVAPTNCGSSCSARARWGARRRRASRRWATA